MANENNNEAKVIDKTATENENMVEISAKELSDLNESNLNLIAERDSLREKVSTLEKELEEKIGRAARLHTYWKQEEDKVTALKKIVHSIPINSYISAKELLDAMVENL